MAVNLTGNEAEQILQTIEMFEVITQANPDDYQSLDLLREAYMKLDRLEDVLRVSKMLAGAYERSGQLSAALEECHFILARNPEEAGVAAMRDSLTQSLDAAKPEDVVQPTAKKASKTKGATSSLITIDRTRTGSGAMDQPLELPSEDGNEMLVRFLLDNQLLTFEAVQSAQNRLKAHKEKRAENELGLSLLEEALRQSNVGDEEDVYLALLERSKMGFIPLEWYEVDRQVVRMLPEEFTLGRLLMPFDLISRTLLIATCNPFDQSGREAVQRHLDYNIQWFFAPPKQIRDSLKDVYRLSEK